MPNIKDINSKRTFKFEFPRECSAGRIWVLMKFGNLKPVYESMSGAFDPIGRIRDWLEDCISVTAPISFSYDQEGPCSLWTYFPLNDDECYFEVYDGGDVNETYARLYTDYGEDCFAGCRLSKRDLVEKIYGGFMKLFKSDKFNTNEWGFEQEKFIRWLEKKLNNFQTSHYLWEIDREDAIEIMKAYLKEYNKRRRGETDYTTNEEYLKLFFPENLNPDNMKKSASERDRLWGRRDHLIDELHKTDYDFGDFFDTYGQPIENYFSLKLEKYINQKEMKEVKDKIKKFYWSPIGVEDGYLNFMVSVGGEAPMLLDFGSGTSLVEFSKRMELMCDKKQEGENKIVIKGKNDNVTVSYKPIDNETGELKIKNSIQTIKAKVNKKQMILTIYTGIVWFHASYRLKGTEFWSNENEKIWNSLSDFYSKKVEKYLGADGLMIRKGIIPRIFKPGNTPTSISVTL